MTWQIKLQKLNAIRILSNGQTCKCCLKHQRLEYSISDMLWETIVPTDFINRTLYIECFIAFAVLKNIKIMLHDIKLITIDSGIQD